MYDPQNRMFARFSSSPQTARLGVEHLVPTGHRARLNNTYISLKSRHRYRIANHILPAKFFGNGKIHRCEACRGGRGFWPADGAADTDPHDDPAAPAPRIPRDCHSHARSPLSAAPGAGA